MGNSTLVTYRRITSNRNHPRNHKIDTITIHCYVGQVTAKQGCDYFARTEKEASANYVVGRDGSIGVSVDECDRSWCTASAANDNRAVTIEVACDMEHPYAVTDEAYDALVKLVADICRRNGINRLIWHNDPDLIGQPSRQNMTVHRWFAATSCPGKYLMDRMDNIARDANRLLGAEPKPSSSGSSPKIRVGDKVRIDPDAQWYGGGSIPDWVLGKTWEVSEISGNRAVLDEGGINSPIHVKYLRKAGAKKPKPKPVKADPFDLDNLVPVQVGSTHELARVVAIILKAYGDLPDTYRIPKNGYVFDDDAGDALERYQERHDLKRDQLAGKITLTEMMVKG